MSSIVNHVNSVHIGSAATTAAAGTKLNALLKGQMALIEATSMVALDAAGAAALSPRATVYIATGQGNGEVKLSAPISGQLVKRYAGTSYTAPVQKNLQPGRDQGGSFTLTVQDETEYQLNILINDDQRPHGQKQTRDQLHYTTKIGATSGEVAFAMSSLFGMKWANGTYKTYGERWVSLGVLSSVAAGVAETSDGTFTFGSKVVSFAGAPVVTPGNYLKVAAPDSNNTGKEYHYLVVDVDTTNNIVYLDSPWQLPSATVVAASMSSNDQATQFAANHAFDIVGLVPVDDWNRIDEYEVVDFDTAFYATQDTGLNGGEADVRVVEPLVSGSGTPNQVYDLEWHAAGYRGVNSRTRWYDSSINPQTNVDFSVAYDMITIAFDGALRSDFNDLERSPQMANLAIIDGSDQSTNFVAILNGFFGTVLGFDDITL